MSEQEIQYIVNLLMKYRENSLTEEENNELQAWAVENHELFEALTSNEIYNELGQDNLSARRVLEKVKGKIAFERTPVRKINVTIWWAAAVFVLLIAGGYLQLHRAPKTELTPAVAKNDVQPGGNKAILTLGDGSTIVLDKGLNGTITKQGNTTIVKQDSGKLAYNTPSEKPSNIVYNTLTTPRAGQFQVVLSDGTKVWLNNASSLRYPTAFRGRDREVELTGEAYFEVAKNKAMPFMVKVAGGQIEVLGTHFNIMAYGDEAAEKTTLLEGSVKVIKGAQNVLLAPGDQSAATPQGQMKVQHGVDVEEVVAWKNGYFHFSGADLPSVMRQLARWYDVEVEYKGNILSQEFSGKIQRNLPISKVLKGLENNEVHFIIEEKKIIVSP
jgi:ferric-dicitrate binding protein FerR (iron transport regulator)